jgi:hypothetical protein
MKSKQVRDIGFTSPIGRGRRAAPGEGLRSIDRPYLLTPTLSLRERGRNAVAAALIVGSGKGVL